MGIVKFSDVGIIEVVVDTFELLIGAVVALISGKNFESVAGGAEVGLVVREELGVHCEPPLMYHVSLSVNGAGGAELAVKHIVAGVVVEQSDVGGDVKAVYRSDGHSPLAGENVGIVLPAVVLVVTHCVAHDRRTREVGLVGVVYRAAVLIHDLMRT